MPKQTPVEEHSAGGVIFRRTAQGLVVLLIKDAYRNWGFPKGHLEEGEAAGDAALREVAEETGLADVTLRGELATIDWHFRFRGRLVHKTCHFFLMETADSTTCPRREEGITACRWATFGEAEQLVAYENAREVLRRAAAQLLAASAGT